VNLASAVGEMGCKQSPRFEWWSCMPDYVLTQHF
jgi:hypothetical protein